MHLFVDSHFCGKNTLHINVTSKCNLLRWEIIKEANEILFVMYFREKLIIIDTRYLNKVSYTQKKFWVIYSNKHLFQCK